MPRPHGSRSIAGPFRRDGRGSQLASRTPPKGHQQTAGKQDHSSCAFGTQSVPCSAVVPRNTETAALQHPRNAYSSITHEAAKAAQRGSQRNPSALCNILLPAYACEQTVWKWACRFDRPDEARSHRSSPATSSHAPQLPLQLRLVLEFAGTRSQP
eukprot:scaffold2130_cov402-Prasinococcus_capsulatus_cf.AAC.2